MNFSDQKRYYCRDLYRLINFPCHGTEMITRTKCDHTCWVFTSWSAENRNLTVAGAFRREDREHYV